MEKVSVIDFFRTGALGPLTIGTSRSWVRKLLGEPGELPGPQFRHRQAPVWKYGMLVLHFAGRTDTVIQIELTATHGNSAPPGIDPWWIGEGATFADARRELADVGISFEDMSPEDSGTLRLLAGAGVELLFRSDPPQTFLGLRYAG